MKLTAFDKWMKAIDSEMRAFNKWINDVHNDTLYHKLQIAKAKVELARVQYVAYRESVQN